MNLYIIYSSDGEWDTDGCQLIQSSNWETTCECNHLSSFALIMDVHEYIVRDNFNSKAVLIFKLTLTMRNHTNFFQLSFLIL